MESKMTAMEWMGNELHGFIHPEHGKEFQVIFDKALAMEKEQHGATWDAALIALDKRGGVLVRAVCDFDEYWENRDTTPNEV